MMTYSGNASVDSTTQQIFEYLTHKVYVHQKASAKKFNWVDDNKLQENFVPYSWWLENDHKIVTTAQNGV